MTHISYIYIYIYIYMTLGLQCAGGVALDAGSHRWVSRARVVQVGIYI